MVGSGVVALPWTFQESGIILGLIICLVGLVVSYRTCILMIRCAGNDKEYFDTLFKYWGKWAYYLGFTSTLLIMVAAVTSYFINLSSMLYYIVLAILEWTHAIPKDFKPVTSADFSVFS
jgi:amino acid permease